MFAPPLLLRDEPLGALDKRLREGLQLEIKRIQREIRSTVIYVTHDQQEALAMSDRIVVMNRGRIEQVGAPDELYERPRTRFVADFLGATNFLEATVIEVGRSPVARTDGGTIAIRPERIQLASHGPADARSWPGHVVECSYYGDSQRYQVRLDSGEVLAVVRPNTGAPPLPVGSAVTAWCGRDDAWGIPA